MDDRLLRDLTAAETDERRAAIVAEYALQAFSPAAQVVARRCVILHWFDPQIVSALCTGLRLREPKRQRIYEELATLPFVERVPWGSGCLTYHSLTREGLLARYAESDPDVLIRGAQLAARAYALNPDELSQSEAFFCQIVAGRTRAALATLEYLLNDMIEREDWHAQANLFALEDEAEALPFVEPLPLEAYHWFARGYTYEVQGDKQKALAAYDRAIELDPEDADSYNNRGLLRAELGDPAGARADYDRAIEFSPQDSAAYNNRGLLRAEQGDSVGALADYTRAIELNPEDADPSYNRGLTHHDGGDLHEALADFDRAIALNPAYADAYHNRGILRRDMGNVRGALADFRRAIELAPQNATSYYDRGVSRRMTGDLDGAMADYRQSLKLNNDDPVAWAGLADAARSLGDAATYRQAIERALALVHTVDAYNRACVFAVTGDTEQALSLLAEALAQKPGLKLWARQDPDLRSLRDDLRFQTLVDGGDTP